MRKENKDVMKEGLLVESRYLEKGVWGGGKEGGKMYLSSSRSLISFPHTSRTYEEKGTELASPPSLTGLFTIPSPHHGYLSSFHPIDIVLLILKEFSIGCASFLSGYFDHALPVGSCG